MVSQFVSVPPSHRTFHVVHPTTPGFTYNRFLGLLLCAHEQHVAALRYDVAYAHERFLELTHRLLQVDNVDTVTLPKMNRAILGFQRRVWWPK